MAEQQPPAEIPDWLRLQKKVQDLSYFYAIPFTISFLLKLTNKQSIHPI